MRRSLVLTNEGSRNRFRASLPTPTVLQRRAPAATKGLASSLRTDMRGFVHTYITGVAAVLAFIV